MRVTDSAGMQLLCSTGQICGNSYADVGILLRVFGWLCRRVDGRIAWKRVETVLLMLGCSPGARTVVMVEYFCLYENGSAGVKVLVSRFRTVVRVCKSSALQLGHFRTKNCTRTCLHVEMPAQLVCTLA